VNRLELVKQVRVLLGYGQTETKPLGDTKVQDQINNVLPQVARDFGQLYTHVNYTTVASQLSYSLPNDFLEFDRAYVHFDSNRRENLYPVNREDFEQLTYTRSSEEGEPNLISVERGATANDDASQLPGDFWLHPIPNAAWTLRFYYYQKPDALAGDTEINELPLYVHMAVALKAAEYLALSIKEPVLSDRMKARYDQELFESRSHSNRGSRNRPLLIKDTQGYSRRVVHGRHVKSRRRRW
jgi:hypothetical protein